MMNGHAYQGHDVARFSTYDPDLKIFGVPVMSNSPCHPVDLVCTCVIWYLRDVDSEI